VHTVDYEANADIFLDLTESPGIEDIFNDLGIDVNLKRVRVGRTDASGILQFRGEFQQNTTFFTNATSSQAATLGRPYMPVVRTVLGTSETSIEVELPLLEVEIAFEHYPSTPLLTGYTTTEAETNAYCIKVSYDDEEPLTEVAFSLKDSIDFSSIIFYAADRITPIAPPTAFTQGLVFYMVFPIDHGKPLGIYDDRLLIDGEYGGVPMSAPIWCSFAQRVVFDDSDDNEYIKVTASPSSFILPYPCSAAVNLTLNIDHKSTEPGYDPYEVTAKYLISTEPTYAAALAASPMSGWPALNIPTNNNTNTVTGLTFSTEPAGTYYIHWYVESGCIYAHSLDAISPPSTYGAFGPYKIVDAPEISIAEPPAICEGTVLDLSASTPTIDWSDCLENASGSWTLNGNYFDPASTLSYSQNGEVLAYIINADCGTFSSNTVTITVHPTLMPSITISEIPGGCSPGGAPIFPSYEPSKNNSISRSSSYTQMDTKGTDFWLTFGRNAYIFSPILQLRIVGSDQPATGTIYYTYLGTSTTFSIAVGEVFTHELSDPQKQAAYNNFTASTTTNYSIHITSSAPVTAYAINIYSATTDASNILPITALGQDYYQISYTPLSSRFDAYAVVATQDNTQVFHNGALTATLHTGQVYYRTSSSDMTGVHVTTDKPVAFFAVNHGPNIPAGYSGADCLFQQLAPVNTWGKNFFIPVSWRGKDRVRVMVSQNGTNISQTGGTLVSATGSQMTLTGLSAGEWVELDVSLTNNGCYIQADKPVGVCAYLTGTRYNHSSDNLSDPAQAWVPAIEQSVNTALIAPFMPSGASNLNAHYALLITAAVTQDNTTVAIGGAAPAALSGGQWYDHSSGYSFYSMPLSSSTASYFFANPAGLVVMGYGTGTAESYYYLASSAMRDLDIAFYVNEIHHQDLPSEVFTVNLMNFRAEIQETMSSQAGHLKWYINEVEETAAEDLINWSKTLPNGVYQLKMEVLLADNVTVKRLESVLIIGLSFEVETCEGYDLAFETNIYNGGAAPTYQWYNNDLLISGATASTYCHTPANGDVLTCILTSNALCAAPETVTSHTIITLVYDKPTIGTFTAPSSFCAGDILNISAPTVQDNGTAVTEQGWILGGTAITMPCTLTLANHDAALFYRAVNECGETTTDTVYLWVGDKPVFTSSLIPPDAVCTGSPLDLTAPSVNWNNSSATGPGTWTLNGDTIDSATTMSMAYDGGTLTYTVANDCGITSADTVSVTVLPMPVPSISAYPDNVCSGGPSILIAEVSGGTTTAMTYTWYDGTTSIEDTNTASYTVNNITTETNYSVDVCNSYGCRTLSNTYTVTVTVNPLPVTTLLVSPDVVCCGDASTLTANVLPAGLTSAMTYSWYEGGTLLGVTDINEYNASALTATADYSVQVLNNLGCFWISDTLSIRVNPLPDIELSASIDELCYGEASTLTAAVSGGTTTSMTYTWYKGAEVLGSGTAAYYDLGSLTATATYSVVVSNENGCSDRSNTVSITVNSLPDIQLTVSPDELCYGAEANLSASVPAGSTTAMSYTWYKGDEELHTNAENYYALGACTATAYYSVVVHNTNGCSDRSNTGTLTVNPLPAATLSAIPPEVCYGATSTLTANVSAGLTPSMSYTWYKGTEFLALTEQDEYDLGALTSTLHYSVSILNDKGCTYTSEPFTLRVNPLPVLSTVDVNICAASSFTVTATSDNSNSDTLYWYSDPLYTQLIIKALSFDMAGLTADNSYYVKVVNIHGCIAQGKVDFTVTQPPQVIAMDDRRICYGEELTLETAFADGDQIVWNMPQTTFRHTASSYYVVTASRPPCPDVQDMVRITVGDSLYISPPALPEFQRNRPYEQQLQSNASSPLFALISGQLPLGISLYGDGTIRGVSAFNQNDPSDYTFTVQITDDYYCVASRTYVLNVAFFVPAVFSPNNDGVNDYFMKGYKLIIFDRLGVKIFEGDDGWDGSCNGKEAPIDTYFYVLFYSDAKEREVKQSGTITLIQ
ncbi:MAG: gliding motility-associated C-terminal domain-containing protein, partial [Bacteroidales bacterium]|nr:gliding motility-associated C-terminal domain-containing protein [Bacteroidales bacterium]